MTGLQRHEAVLDSIAAGVTVQDAGGRLIYANREAAALSGFATPEEMLAAGPEETARRFELIDEAGGPLPWSALPGRRLLAGEQPPPVVVGFRVRATGEERWAIVIATPLPSGDGLAPMAVNTFHDLTLQIRAEREIRASEQRQREIVEALPVVAWLTDRQGLLVTANGRWLEYTGKAAVPGRQLDAGEAIHPDDRSVLAEAWRRAVADGEPLEAAVRLRRHDGVDRWHLVRAATLIGDDGAIEGWICTATDIHAEREASISLADSERLFHDLTDNAPMLVWTSDATGARTFFNRYWLEFTGRALVDEIGDAWRDGIHPDDRDRVATSQATAIERGEPWELEFRLRRQDGRWRWILDIGVPRTGLDGAVVGYVGSGVDIEDRHRTVAQAQLIAEATLRLDETVGLDETVDAAASVAIPAVADWCVIDLLEADGTSRRAAVAAATDDMRAAAERLRDFPPTDDPDRAGSRVVGGREAILFGDLTDPATMAVAAAHDDDLAAAIAATGAQSAIVQPLLARGEVIGVVFFVVGPERTYTESDIELTAELARRIALPIANARLYHGEQLARRAAEAAAERLERLQWVTRRLAAARTRQAVVDLVVREGRQALGAGAASIVLPDADGGPLRIAASDGYDASTIARFATIPADSPVPLATVIRTSSPIWLGSRQAMTDAIPSEPEVVAASPNHSACAVPLVADGRTFGALGLSFTDEQPFDLETRSLIEAYADLGAQALARVTLGEVRELLLADLEAERARLEALLRQMPDGLMIAEAPSGRVVLANDRVEKLLGVAPVDLDHAAGGEAYRGFDADGRELAPEDWPLFRAVHGETVAAEIELLRPDGNRIWISKRASPVFDRSGRVVAGIVSVIDISEARRARELQQFLTSATEILASSLDYEVTIRKVAQLAVPRIAEWCAVDIVDESGTPRRIAVSHVDRSKVELVHRIQEEYPPDPSSPIGLHAVLRSGEPVFIPDIPPETIEAAARDERHLELIRQLELRSYICVPLVSAGRVLGAISLAGSEATRRFGQEDLSLAEDLAARAASAVANARLFHEGVRFKKILDASLDVVFMFDPVTLTVSYANQGAIDQMGRSREELLDVSVGSLIDDVDAIGLRGLIEPLVSGDVDGRRVTLPFRRRDGRTAPMEVSLQHVAPPGEAPRILAVARDITERIEAQERLRRLAELEHARAAELNAVIRAMGEGVFVCAADGRITLANPAAEGLFPDVDEQTYADVLAQMELPDDGPALGTAAGPVELRAKGDDERWIELSTYPVAAPLGEAAGELETIVMLRDVTAQRQAQLVRDTFIGVLSHELRTPVTTIFAGSKVLARQDAEIDEATRRDIFSDIVTESERLHRLVEDVIAMTRFGEDESDVGSEPVLLQRIVPTVLRSEEARWPGVTFELETVPGLPTVAADPTYVEQVIRNLLSNAAKYGGPGTAVAVQVEAEDEEVRVRILDDGPGFAPDEADRLFELFFRSPRTSRAAAGAGIGLFVCARLIRAMGGRIWATNRPEQGAEFGFALRVMADDA